MKPPSTPPKTSSPDTNNGGNAGTNPSGGAGSTPKQPPARPKYMQEVEA